MRFIVQRCCCCRHSRYILLAVRGRFKPSSESVKNDTGSYGSKQEVHKGLLSIEEGLSLSLQHHKTSMHGRLLCSSRASLNFAHPWLWVYWSCCMIKATIQKIGFEFSDLPRLLSPRIQRSWTFAATLSRHAHLFKSDTYNVCLCTVGEKKDNAAHNPFTTWNAEKPCEIFQFGTWDPPPPAVKIALIP